MRCSPAVSWRKLRSYVGCTAASITYDGISDRDIRIEPTLPKLGPAGTTFKDRTFGSVILRVTDGETPAQHRGSPFRTAAGCFVEAWSCDSHRFFVRSDEGALFFDFEPARMEVRQAGPLPMDGPTFSGVTNDLLYGVSERRIIAYSVARRTSSVVLDLESVVKKYSQYEYAVSVSAE